MAIGNRRHISKEVKEYIIVMSAHMSSQEIAKVTGISKRIVNRVKRLALRTGKVVNLLLQAGQPYLPHSACRTALFGRSKINKYQK